MNKEVVSIEVLKSYFETGKKPTQAQFGALVDAFYHKNETIPQSQIEGLDTTLEAKAETTDLDTKANADGSGLTAENIEQWKEVLGVGELPENNATIDQDGEKGNVYDKTQVDNLLENSGKNLGNSDLQLESGEVRTLDITGAKFQMKGLQDKQADASFNKKLIVNDNGEFAVKEDGDVIINMPSEVLHTVNHIYPNNVPAQPSYVLELQKILERYKFINLIPITKSDLDIKTIDNIEVGNNVISNDNVILLNTSTGFNAYATNVDVLNITANNIVLPADKNWVFKVNCSLTANPNTNGVYVGIVQSIDDYVKLGIWSKGYGVLGMINTSKDLSNRFNLSMLMIKIGNNIWINVTGENNINHTFNIQPEFGDFIPKISLKRNATFNGKMFYKILD